jgi:hypothetical protein
MVKKFAYEPIEGDELSFEIALNQAATALDAAGVLAQEQNDHKALVDVADRWLTVCNGLGGTARPQAKNPVGFTAPDDQPQHREIGEQVNGNKS